MLLEGYEGPVRVAVSEQAQVTTKISQVPTGAKDADDFRQQGPLQGSLNTSGQDKQQMCVIIT